MIGTLYLIPCLDQAIGIFNWSKRKAIKGAHSSTFHIDLKKFFLMKQDPFADSVRHYE